MIENTMSTAEMACGFADCDAHEMLRTNTVSGRHKVAGSRRARSAHHADVLGSTEESETTTHVRHADDVR